MEINTSIIHGVIVDHSTNPWLMRTKRRVMVVGYQTNSIHDVIPKENLAKHDVIPKETWRNMV
jgi:hypothetical protein